MTTAMIIMIAVMAFSSIGLMFVAIVEFVMYLRQSRNQVQQPIIYTAPIYQPAPEAKKEEKPDEKPAEKAEEKAEEAPEEKPEEKSEEKPEEALPQVIPVEEDDENSVTFEVTGTQRLTLKDAYNALGEDGQGYYNKIMEAAGELEMARIIEATYAVTIMQGRDNIGKLKIARGAVVLDCTVINPDLVKYNKENGKKIKSRPTRFRIESQEELDAAIYTLTVANQTSLENRNLKKKAEPKAEESIEVEPETTETEEIKA